METVRFLLQAAGTNPEWTRLLGGGEPTDPSVAPWSQLALRASFREDNLLEN